MTKSEIETLIRGIIKDRSEYDKIDQKSSYDFNEKKDRIRFVRCIAAIANTDSTYYDNVGYIILGAKNGRLIGGINALEEDATSANFYVTVGEYVDPVIDFRVEKYKDDQVGWWGVIVIPPSSETHVIKKDFNHPKFKIRKGDIYVRYGDSTPLADKTDIDRLQRRKFKAILDHLETELKALQEKQEAQKPDLKIYAKDGNGNRKESIKFQPVFWEKTNEQLEEETNNDAEIGIIEKELENLKTAVLTTSNMRALSSRGEELRGELNKRKRKRFEWEQDDPLLSRIIELNFLLSNDGNTLASGINIYLYFPSFLNLSADKNSFLSQRSGNPQLGPVMSLLPGIFASSQRGPNYALSPPIPDSANPKYGGPEILERGAEKCARYWIEKLPQDHSHSLDPIYFVSPDNDRNIEISYKIYAENAPGLSEGVLQLIIRPNKGSEESQTS